MASENFSFLVMIYWDINCQNVSSCRLGNWRLCLCFSLFCTVNYVYCLPSIHQAHLLLPHTVWESFSCWDDFKKTDSESQNMYPRLHLSQGCPGVIQHSFHCSEQDTVILRMYLLQGLRFTFSWLTISLTSLWGDVTEGGVQITSCFFITKFTEVTLLNNII